MAGLAVAHANVHHTLKAFLLLPDSREGDALFLSKLRSSYGRGYVHYGQRLFLRRHYDCMRNRRGISRTMLILPRASISIESCAQHLPDYWQNVTKVFEAEVYGTVKLLSNGISSHLILANNGEAFLPNFSAIPIDLTVVAVATIVGSTLGSVVTSLLASKNENFRSKGSGHMESPREKWLLITKSTPFNRFVMMRCPSIEFEDDNAHDGLSKGLSTEVHHVIALSRHIGDTSDRIDTNGLGKNSSPIKDSERGGSFVQTGLQNKDTMSSFQRDFLHTDDGGVLAVDWPSHLELSGEHGLDTTLLIISGSVDGSGDKLVRELVKKSVKCGYFPIVLNPRGCGGSLLTTPRLFTAGDSDDVRMAVQFALKSRSWATIVAVGWEYGANMLVKYLGEETSTPVIAAVCVDSIFNIKELNSRNGEDQNICFHQKIMSGLVQILKSNQMLFQGKREFDVQKALSATSLRDFDETISMVSKGYRDVEEFYKDSSSNSWINNVKIPVFCIQMTQGIENGVESIGKMTSIGPCVSEENPYTTLIFQLTSRGKLSFQTTTDAYDSLMIEWLAAVEMAFLKGRNPLLQADVDVTYQPPAKGRPALQRQQSYPNGGEPRMRNTIPLKGTRRVDNFNNHVPSVNHTEVDLKDWKRDGIIEMNAPPKERKALIDTSKDMYRVDKEKLTREGDSERGKDANESNDKEKSSREGDGERGKELHVSSNDESGDDKERQALIDTSKDMYRGSKEKLTREGDSERGKGAHESNDKGKLSREGDGEGGKESHVSSKDESGDDKERQALIDTSKDLYRGDKEKLTREGDSERGKGAHESNDKENLSRERDGERGKGANESNDKEKLSREGDGERGKELHVSSNGDDEPEVEPGQVQQAAESIMKVLDVTMPGTLSEKQKGKVLEAVGRGESIVTALQEACPEDVREKMTTAVSAAVQARGISSKLAGFGKGMPAPRIPDGMVDSIQEKLSSMVQNKQPAVITHDAAKTPLPDKSADNSSDVAGQKQQTSISGHNDGEKPLQQSETNPSALQAGQSENGAAMEQVPKGGSVGGEQLSTHGQGHETETHNDNSLERKMNGQEKGDSKAKPDSTASQTNQGDTKQAERQDGVLSYEDHKCEKQDQKQESGGALPQRTESSQKEKNQEKGDKLAQPASNDSGTNQGDAIHAQKQSDPLPHEDQTHEGQDQKQESVGSAPQTIETPQVEKKNDSNTTSEDLSKRSPDLNRGEVSSPQTQSPAAPQTQASDVPQTPAATASQTQTPNAPETQAPAAPQMQAPDVPQTPAPTAPQTQTIDAPQTQAPAAPQMQAPDAPQTPAPTAPQTQLADAPPTQAPAAPPLPSIDVGRAFEALTGVDDATQMAVTNVFGVIENVIDKLEKDQGQEKDQLEQPSSPKHQSSALQTSHSESAPENSTQNQSPHDIPSQNDAGHQKIPKTGSDELVKQRVDSKSIQTSPNTEVVKISEKTKPGTDNNCPADLPPTMTERKNDSTFDVGQHFDGGDLALKDCDDESLWKLIDGMPNSKILSGTQDNSRAKKQEEDSHTGNSNLDRFNDMDRSQVITPEHLIADNELEDSEIQMFSTVENFDDIHSAFLSENSVSDGMGSPSLCKPKKMQELVKNSLEIELCRMSGSSILDTALKQDIEKVAFAVANKAELSLQLRKPAFADKSLLEKTSGSTCVKMTGSAEKMRIETVTSAINEAYGKTVILSNLLPPGVLVDVVLAGLSPLEFISTDDTQDSRELVHNQGVNSGLRSDLALAQNRKETGFADSKSTNSDRPEKPHMIEQSHGFTNKDACSEQDSGSDVEVDPHAMEQLHGFTENGASSEQDSGQSDGVDPYVMEQSHGFTENGARSELDSGSNEDVGTGLSPKDAKIPGDADTCESDTVGGSSENASSHGNNMMGAVAAAMGTSAVLASQMPSSESISSPFKHEQQKANTHTSSTNVGRFGSENGGDTINIDDSNSSIVSTLAEKAMSVAAPVVPTKEDGEVDQERLVEVLGGMGQKGGILRLVGKIALLWGGLRGAMSLTDRLLGFLRMSDRPLHQRVLGFMAMAVLLWLPVLVPLLPALLQQWASQSHNSIASTAALIGLYGAVVILITIWGRKVRGYEDPLRQYGVSIEPAFNAKQVLSLMGGLMLGTSLVACVYLLGAMSHMIQIDWAPALFSNSSNTFLWSLASSWKFSKILAQCFGISLAVSFVEELFFRSWLQDEISADFGFHKAALLSGLAFSISHWSLPIMPALWLLSLVLAGAKVRCDGDLSLVIGLHAGMMAAAQLIGIVAQITYGEDASLWFVAPQSGDPFTGAIGLSILAVLALLSYPWDFREDER